MASDNDADDATETDATETEPDHTDDATETDAPTDTKPNIDGLKRALAEERKWRRDHESIVKDAKARADRDKSEVQKLNEAIESEKVARTKAEAKVLRYEVANEKGVPAKLMRFLQGDSKEELEEMADALLAELGETPTNGKPSMDRPRSSARVATGKASATDEGRTTADLAAEILDD